MSIRSVFALLLAAMLGLPSVSTDAQTRGSNRDGTSVGIPGGRVRPNSELKRMVSAGLWEINWIETRLTPAMRATETVFRRCYTAQDVARSSNPVMPAEQEKQCRTVGSMVGSDGKFETECTVNGKTVYHQLRLEECPDGLCGKYIYMPPGKGNVLDTIVLMVKIADTCQ